MAKAKKKPAEKPDFSGMDRTFAAPLRQSAIEQFETVEPCDFWSRRQKVWNEELFAGTKATLDLSTGCVFLVGAPGRPEIIVVPLSNVNYVRLA